jgi:MarR family 2-MHQ and catechol resistance regulon transcriptional repressor
VKEATDVSGTHVWLVMMRAYRATQKWAVRSVEAAGVGLSDFGVLELLLHKGPQPVNEIGHRIGLTSGAITVAVDRLEACKLVARGSHPTDRRARVVALTAEGRARAAALFKSHQAAMDSAGEALTKTERAELIRLLKKLGTFAEQHAANEKEK